MGVWTVRSRHGLVALLMMVVASLTLVDAPVAAEPADLQLACPDPMPATPFVDVDGNAHASAIRCLAAWELTQGVDQERFAPDREVPRAQMASFLVNLLEAAGVDLPEIVAPVFTDVGGTHANNIEVLAELGVTQGRAPGVFAPDQSVTRAQMASFLAGALDQVGVMLPDQAPPFADSSSSVHAPAIGALAALEVVQGLDAQRFDPSGAVSRAQMASLLMRTLEVLVEAGFATPPYLVDADLPDEGGTPADPEVPSGELMVATNSLPEASLGLSFGVAVQALGGRGPYEWSFAGLPAGLQGKSTGEITGMPLRAGAWSVEVSVLDAENDSASRSLTLIVSEAGVPEACVAQDCLELTPATGTVEVAGSLATGVFEDGDSIRVAFSRAPEVLPPIGGHLVLVAESSRDPLVILQVSGIDTESAGLHIDGTRSGLGSAYSEGVLHLLETAEGTVDTPSDAGLAGFPGSTHDGGVSLAAVTCTSEGSQSVNVDAQVDVEPGAYVAWDVSGVTLAEVNMELDVALAAQASVSGTVSCNLALPSPPPITFPTPMGVPGLLRIDPVLSFKADASMGAGIGTTTACYSMIRYSRASGGFANFHSCWSSNPLLDVSLDAPRASADVAATLKARLTLSDLVGATGALEAGVTGNFTPTSRPTATLALRGKASLGGCIGCFLGSNAVSGTLIERNFGPYQFWSTTKALSPVSAVRVANLIVEDECEAGGITYRIEYDLINDGSADATVRRETRDPSGALIGQGEEFVPASTTIRRDLNAIRRGGTVTFVGTGVTVNDGSIDYPC